MRKARADLSTPSQKQQQQQLKRSNEAPPRSSKRKHANHHHRREEAGASRKRREEAENHRYRDRPTGNRERTINPDKSAGGGAGSVRRKNWAGRGFGSHATEEGWWCSRRRRGAGPWRGAASARRASAPAPPLPLPHLLRPSRPPRGHHHSTAQAQCESSRDETRRERRW